MGKGMCMTSSTWWNDAGRWIGWVGGWVGEWVECAVGLYGWVGGWVGGWRRTRRFE